MDSFYWTDFVHSYSLPVSRSTTYRLVVSESRGRGLNAFLTLTSAANETVLYSYAWPDELLTNFTVALSVAADGSSEVAVLSTTLA